MKLKDFKGLFKKTEIEVISVENMYDDYYSIKLKTNQKWLPGEHGIFSLPGKEIVGKKWRAFSVASITEEGYMLLGTRTGQTISSFKEHLINMKEGDRVKVIGPFGWFKLEDNKTPIVMAASGVGITPIRALLKSIEHDVSRKVEVIYSAKDYFLFGDELEVLASQNEMIHLTKTNGREAFSRKLSELALEEPNAYYYISGAPTFLKSTKKMLKAKGIKKIINDPFLGY